MISVLACERLPETLTAAELCHLSRALLGIFWLFLLCLCVGVCPAFLLFCHINTNQCDTSRESASSQAVTTEPVGCRLPKDTFIMHPYVGLEGQRSCSSFCQLIRKSIDQFAGAGWCFWEYTCLSVSNNPGTRARRYTPLRVNKEFHRTCTRTGESYTPVHLCRACLSLERDSVMREQSGHL